MLLGIDTGGTYTDAVLYDEAERRVLASAKAPTTHHDLSIGVNGAIDAVLAAAAGDPASVELVSISTTLATNALVEGKGRPVAAVMIGFTTDVVERAGLAEALAGDPLVMVAGGHDAHGTELTALDVDGLAAAVAALAGRVDAFAVTSVFGVRNAHHEIAAGETIRRLTGLPVTLSHHLSAALNGPRRAVTAVLNARLVPVIDGLVRTTELALATRGLDAPLMVVRGDGSLVSAEFVRERPIETILSGPAASLVGAAHLTGLVDAIISDVGGTTTDIAVLRDGRPEITEDGAVVGGHRTMVKAVDMRTHGLGGDSRLGHDERAIGARLHVGPRRIIPLCQLAVDAPNLVHEMLDQQLTAPSPGDLDGIVLVAEDWEVRRAALDGVEREVLDRMGGRLAVAATTLNTLKLQRVLHRLVQRGVVQLAAFTPTDAAHVLGGQSTYDRGAARKAAALFARRRDRLGRSLAESADEVAANAFATFVRRSAEAVLAAAFEHDGLPPATVAQPLVQAALDRRLTAAPLAIGLGWPLVALGASASLYYPAVAELLGADVVVPEHAEVANAVGAVVGLVRIERECVITSPQTGQFLVHGGEAPVMATDLAVAHGHARDHLAPLLAADMAAAGAGQFETTEQWEETTVPLQGAGELFIEGRLRLVGTGRPAHRVVA